MRNERTISIDAFNPLSDLPAQDLLKELTQRSMTIAVAEGCTGGRILNKITIPGATKVFKIGTIAYSKDAKIRLGVRPKLIEKYGEYSPEVAVEMAKSVRKLGNDDFGIATVGEFTPKNSVVYVAIAQSHGSIVCLPIHTCEQGRVDIKSIISNNILSRFLVLLRGSDLLSGQALIIKEEGESIAESLQLAEILRQRGMTISTMESCTGGSLGDSLTNIPGSSNYFDSSWVVYDENSKRMFGVPLSTMAFGQVYSSFVSEEMAKALKRKTNTDIVIATTGTMDNWDTRPYHLDSPPGTIYYSIGVYNKIFTKKIRLKPQKRKIMKRETEQIIFQNIIDLIHAHEVGCFDSFI